MHQILLGIETNTYAPIVWADPIHVLEEAAVQLNENVSGQSSHEHRALNALRPTDVR